MGNNRQKAIDHGELEERDPERDEPHVTESAPLSDLVSAESEREDALTAGVMRAGEAGSVDNADTRAWEIEIGTDVICAGGQKLGEVVAVDEDYIVVEKGFFMPQDVYVPKSAIRKLDEHALVLNVSKDTALHSGWEEDPEHIVNPGPRLH